MVDNSPVNSSSSDDFAAFLDTELDSTSDASPEPEEDVNEIHNSDINRTKRQKIEVLESVSATEVTDSTSEQETTKAIEVSVKEDQCTHPGVIGGMCMKCGEKIDTQSGVAFSYIHKDLRLADDEIARLRDRDLKSLFARKKLCLVLDLDHTLLNSTHLADLKQEEGHLLNSSDPIQDALRGSLFKLDYMNLMTKLRPFVHTFLKEASKLFEMYIYTMGERTYALKMADLLDPQMVYFSSRVIAQGDCTQRHQKGLDVVLGNENVVLILDDTEGVWGKHKDNLILMERYHYFASSCAQFGYTCQSLSELKSDESEADGALTTILELLKKIHNKFFDLEVGEDFAGRDVRKVLETVRSEVLKGCRILFSHVFPTKFQAKNHHLWKMAERLGATCVTEVDPSVTHVISTDVRTDKSRWAVQEKKYLVDPRWLEAANYRWHRQPEEQFPAKIRKSR
uniref:RNA polymerase II C-terminal domain phosphatase-like 4 n=1 Tax=Erigeron canadensis TaxID=72917 RepID=UPI001CB8BECD|nr:RNA polymerase II C-terminal domain phosphatase-like 4 [Erigeron canadensis]